MVTQGVLFAKTLKKVKLLLVRSQESFKINDHLGCNEKCLVYLLACKVVGKFRPRWDNYKESDGTFLRKPSLSPYTFLNGFTEDINTFLIDKTQISDPHRR